MWRCLLLIISCQMYESYGSAPFTAYWNVPVGKCQRYGVTFDLDQFGIVHNENNNFRGGKVNLFYPNAFKYPSFDKKNNTINGGIPQLGDLALNVDTFHKAFTKYESPDFDGLSVLDFEDYMPWVDGRLRKIYKDASLEWARNKHPDWTASDLQKYSFASFTESVQPHFKVPLLDNAAYAPKALIGHYHFPYCHNYAAPYNQCPKATKKLNDLLQDTIYGASTALFPSVYVIKKHGHLYYDYVAAALDETTRVNLKKLPVLPYIWYRYHEDPAYLPDDVALAVLWLIKSKGGSGLVLWGSDMTQNLADKPACLKFQAYMERFLGPAMKCIGAMTEAKMYSLNAQYPVVSVNNDAKSQQNLQLLMTSLKTLCKLAA